MKRFYQNSGCIMYNMYCRDKGPKLYIGPWALAKDVDWSEDK